MGSDTDLLLFEQYSGGRWEEIDNGPVLVKRRWGHPHDTVREHLDSMAAQLAVEQGIEVGELDNALRVTVWRNATVKNDELDAPGELPAERPDAMVVYRKPDDSILQAALNAAAPFYAPYIANRNNVQAASHYHGAYRVVQAVLDAHGALTRTTSTVSAGDLISVAAALLPEHR